MIKGRTGKSVRQTGKRKPAAKKQANRRTKPSPERLRSHSTAKKLSAMERAERQKKQRWQQIRKALLLLAVFFGLSAALLGIKVLFFRAEPEAPAPLPVQEPAAVPDQPAAEPVPQLPETPEPEPPAPALPSGEPDPQPAQPAAGIPDDPQQPETTAESAGIPPGSGTLCFVFDDAGHNLFHLEPFLRLPFPCTIAVLPALPHSAECAENIRAAGKEAILHQPMQALNPQMDPGPGAILPDMQAEDIRMLVAANLDAVGPVSGMNNHEGSRITADRAAMDAVFDVLEARGLYFLDSRTNAETAVPEAAAGRRIPVFSRSVFLDNSQEETEILQAVRKGAQIAAQNGYAVLIGHVWSEHLAEILTGVYPALVRAGYTVSELADLRVRTQEEDGR